MIYIRTAEQLRTDIETLLPMASGDTLKQFVTNEAIFEAAKVKGYLRGKLIQDAPSPKPYAPYCGMMERIERNRQLDKRITAVGNMVRDRLLKELG